MLAILDLRCTGGPIGCAAEVNPHTPDPISDVPLYAVLGTFNEADVIDATIENAFRQGVERVYLIDNASTDETVNRAVAAGAILAETYETPTYDESTRTLAMNWTVLRISLAEEVPHIWWLWMDADEFSHGPGDLTIAQYLAQLDRRFRIVGADVYQHYPDGKPEYISGFHPLDFQPMCFLHRETPVPRCRNLHRKHPLQRFDRSGPFITSMLGFHQCTAGKGVQLLEPPEGIVMHHFQYRDEALTRKRIGAVYGDVDSRLSRANSPYPEPGHARLDSLDAVYSQRWSEVDNQSTIKGDVGVNLVPWSSVSSSEPARWYSEEERKRATKAWETRLSVGEADQ